MNFDDDEIPFPEVEDARREMEPTARVVFLNQRFVPRDRARVSIFDRGFLYGDGLFETIRVYLCQPCLLARHLERLRRGAAFLGIPVPLTDEEIQDAACRLVARNRALDCVLRITLSRGVGERGYSPKDAGPPTFAMSLHPLPHLNIENPPGPRLITSSVRLIAGDPLAAFKTANRLPYVLARGEADRQDADEALLLNDHGQLAEASAANLFWLESDTLCTPPVSAGILPGITRGLVLELASKVGLNAVEATGSVDRLRKAAVAFLTSSTRGIVEVGSLDGQPLASSAIVGALREAHHRRLCQELAP